MSARNDRICGSILGSVEASGAASAILVIWVMRIAPIIKTKSLGVGFMGMVHLLAGLSPDSRFRNRSNRALPTATLQRRGMRVFSALALIDRSWCISARGRSAGILP